MADKRCDNGHFIDESWDICPYCPQDLSEPEIPIVRPQAVPNAAAQPVRNAPQEPLPSPGPHPVPQAPSPAQSSAPPTSRAAAVPSPERPSAPARDFDMRVHRATTPGGVASAAHSLAQASPQPMERTMAAQRLDPGHQSKRYVVGWLVSLNGPTRGESFPVRMGRNVIGRDRRSDIIINDDQASSHHADLVFRPEEKRFILMDHNSTNGTYVNEAEIEPRRDLVEKDVIRVGSHRFIFAALCHDGFHWDDEGLLR